MTLEPAVECLWQSLAADAAVPAMLLGPGARLLRITDGWKRINPEATHARGPAAFSAGFWSERSAFVDRALAGAAPVRLIEMVRGVLLQTTFRPCSAIAIDAVLATSRLATADGDKTDVIVSEHPDMGRLGDLTERELELLHHIGMGRSSEDAARLMHRSTRTVEWHRASLGQKLRCSNRVELARIAFDSGLTAVDIPFLVSLRRTVRSRG